MTYNINSLVDDDFYHKCSCCHCMQRRTYALIQQESDRKSEELTLTTDALISNEFANHTRNALTDNGGETLYYYIDNTTGWSHLDDGWGQMADSTSWIDTNFDSAGHSRNEIAFIQDIFEKVDPLIDLDFLEQTSYDGSDIDIYSVNQVDDWYEDGIVGQVRSQGYGSSAWWDVLWKDTDGEAELSDFDRNTIIHELGHALGLSHPNEDPTNIHWDTSDTVMSYNQSINGWDYWFSDADITALQSIWGVENDPILNADGSDLKAIIDQVTGMDDVSGVIFRLYNAAFARLPDPDGLSNWINANETGSFSYEQTASEFIDSQESINLYGSNQVDTNYITTVYNNVLDRDPDSAGLSHYEGLLGSGEMSRAKMMFDFSESPENRALFTDLTGIS